jgi:hypothetical protein
VIVCMVVCSLPLLLLRLAAITTGVAAFAAQLLWVGLPRRALDGARSADPGGL